MSSPDLSVPSRHAGDVAAEWGLTLRRMRPAVTECRIAAFVAAGLDESRIRAWAVIRGAYLQDDPAVLEVLRALV